MNCPACGTPDSSIDRTVPNCLEVLRRRKCRCGASWTTVERANLRTLTTVANRVAMPLGAEPGPAISGRSEIGGTLGGKISGSLSGSETPAASQPPSRARRGRKNTHEYTADFNEAWDATGHYGNKLPAFKSWLKCTERISPDELKQLVIKRWAEWMKTDRWRRGFVPHLSTWLSDNGFENEVPAHALRPADEKLAPWEERQRKAKEEAQERERIASRRAQEQVDRKLAEMRKYQGPQQELVASLANGKAL